MVDAGELPSAVRDRTLMPTRLPVLVLVLLGMVALRASGASLEPNDPLQAPECREAIDALGSKEAAAASAPAAATGTHAVDPKLMAARKRAAQVCLAARADPPPAVGRLAQPPLAVPPVIDRRPPIAPPAPTAASPTRVPTAPPLVSITSCDAAGCWMSDGTRLNRVGPTLWGRRGACTVQGTVVRCP
jgi:hypothetical protein